MTVSVAGSVAYSFDGVTLPSDGTNSVVRSNPFVTNAVSPADSLTPVGGILQTSDIHFSELRLKSIGTAVGLVPIGNPRPTQPPLEVSQPKSSQVRINPLASVQSDQFDRPVIGLVEVPVSPPPTRQTPNPVAAQARGLAQRSQTRIVGSKYCKSPTAAGTPVAVAQAAPVTQDKSSTAVDSIETSEVVTREAIASGNSSRLAEAAEPAVAMQVAATDAANPASNGFSFSLTDLNDASIGDSPEVASKDNVSATGVSNSETTEQPAQFLIPPPIVCAQPPNTSTVELAFEHPVEARAEESFAERLPLLPTPNPRWTQHQDDSTLQTSNSTDAFRYPDRRRAHVEVVAPPMILVQSDQGREREDVATVTPTRIVPAKLAGFQRKPSQRSESKRSESTPSGALAAPDATPSSEVTSPTPLESILKRIRQTYRSSQVQISEVKGKLVVRGVCPTPEDATEIIRLIRSEFLVPVDDQIVIR